jgi:hypothetical protein
VTSTFELTACRVGQVFFTNYCFGFQAAIWHCLNHYAYADAIFLAERLYAEGKFHDIYATSWFIVSSSNSNSRSSSSSSET